MADHDTIRDALRQMVDAFSPYAWGGLGNKSDALNAATAALSHFIDDVEAAEGGPAWIAITERLPDLEQSVVLIDANRWENTGGDLVMNVRACGYLDSIGGMRFWSIRGERAIEVNTFTHWMPLAAPPAMKGEQP